MPKASQKSSRRIWFFVFIPLLFILATLIFRIFLPWQPLSMKHLFSKHHPLNIGHRGGAALGLENTMSAFKAGLKAGADGFEFDVMETADRQIIVFHDKALQKRLPIEGVVRQKTLAELRKIDLSPYFKKFHSKIPKALHAEKIPTLIELFRFLRKHPHLIINLEIKNEDLIGRGTEKRIAHLIRVFGFQKRIIVSSFNPFALWRFKRVATDIPTGLIYSDHNVPIYIKKLWFLWLARPDALHPHYKIVTPSYMKWARKRGFRVNVWTVDDPKEMKRMIQLGVDMIITNYPDRLAKILHPKK